MKEAAAADRLGLTEQQFQRFAQACRRTWQAIGGDVLGDSDRSMRRNEVIEVVLDAGYMGMYGEQQSKDWAAFYKGTLAPWVSKHYHLPRFLKLMKEVFQHERYGQ